ncbi:MAG: phosphoribosyl-ATP diphosphatase [Aestuariivita sp.]|nr:phosphoribosyl-ATP diphosphatase [Aestuariivita sp.]
MNALEKLAQTISSRKNENVDKSWTARLLSQGPHITAQKFGEEAIEAVIEAIKGDKIRLISESADVLYHLLVMLAAHNISLNEVLEELEQRQGKSGLVEKKSRSRKI